MTVRNELPIRPITPGVQKYHGSCHCGAVRFEVRADLSQGASRCNCTACTKLATLGNSVKPDAFELLQGAESLSSYECGGKIMRRYFCKHCGVLCYAAGELAQLGGKFVSVNYNALDDIDPSELKVAYWDGRHDNWQAGQRDTPWPIRDASA